MHEERLPHPLLRDVIKCLWVSERDFSPPHDTLTIFPDSTIELIFNFGVPCQLARGDVSYTLPSTYVVGLLNEPFQLRASGTVKVVAARFYAWGFVPLMGFAAGSEPLTDPLERVADLYASLKQRLSLGNDAGLETLNTFLLEHFLQAQLKPGHVAAAAKTLVDMSGRAKIAELAHSCGLSRRQLERAFGASVGLSPKALAVRIRFERVRDALARHPDTDLAGLADVCGYADQAHLTREFRTFSGHTPRQFARELSATHSFLRTHYDAFFQDLGATSSLD